MSYSLGDGAGLTKRLVHSITEPLAKAGNKAKKDQAHKQAQDDALARKEHFAKGQQDHEVALQKLSHEHALSEKGADHAHEASMLRLAHNMHRTTVRSEAKAGVTEGNTTFSSKTVQANGGTRKFATPAEHTAAPAATASAAPKPAAAGVNRTKPVTIGSKPPRGKAAPKPAGSAAVTFQAP